MSITYRPVATDNLDAQHNLGLGKDWIGVNLDAMWRAKGRPEGDDPRSWLAMVEPVLLAMQDYYRLPAWDKVPVLREDRLDIHPVEGLSLHKESWFLAPHWEPDDLAADHFVASLYAAFLDREAFELYQLAGDFAEEGEDFTPLVDIPD